MASIGHELQHAVEVLSDRAIRSSSAMTLLYNKEGDKYGRAAVQDRRDAQRVGKDLERLRGDKGLFAYEIGIIRAALGKGVRTCRTAAAAHHGRELDVLNYRMNVPGVETHFKRALQTGAAR